MKSLIHSTMAVLCCTLTFTALAQNRVLTVDNNPGAVAMFKDFDSAYQAAQDGDTILLAGSDAAYERSGGDDGYITKRLNIVGPGYLLKENNIPGLSSKRARLTAAAGSLRFSSRQTSASGSTLTGLDVHGVEVLAGVHVTIDRCRLGGVADWYTPNPNLAGGRVTIRRCYLDSVRLREPGSSVFNSIVRRDFYLGIGTIAANCVIIVENVLAEELSTISSSIFVGNTTPVPTATQFANVVKGSITHCMAVGGDFLPQGSGNINGVRFREDVFAATGGDSGFIAGLDSYWQLKPGSPAIGKGLDGVDMGAFGGASPYILSGVPSRPRVTRLSVPALVTSGSGLRFEVDAQSF